MNSLLLYEYYSGGSLWLTAALIIVEVLLIIASISAIISKITLAIKYNKFNRVETSLGHTAFSACRTLLDENGMSDVEIKEAGFFRALFYGNHYCKRQKTVYFRKGIINSTSITAVGIAVQKVGLVIQDKEDNPAFKYRAMVAPFAIFGYVLVLPITILGIIFDVVFTLGSVFAILSVIISFIIFVVASVFSMLSIPVESRANKLALELMVKTKMLNEEEQLLIKDVFSAYMISYVLDFVVALLLIIKVVFQIILISISN